MTEDEDSPLRLSITPAHPGLRIDARDTWNDQTIPLGDVTWDGAAVSFVTSAEAGGVAFSCLKALEEPGFAELSITFTEVWKRRRTPSYPRSLGDAPSNVARLRPDRWTAADFVGTWVSPARSEDMQFEFTVALDAPDISVSGTELRTLESLDVFDVAFRDGVLRFTTRMRSTGNIAARELRLQDDGDSIAHTFTVREIWKKVMRHDARIAEGLAAYDEGDYPAAFCILRPLADIANAKVQLAIGYMYDNGLGVAPDQSEAAAWYRRAADQGSIAALYNLATLYRDGVGVPKDLPQAATFFRRAAERGDADAQAELGAMYHAGQGLRRDTAEAAKWFGKAAEQGHARAQFSLAALLEHGDGVLRDIRRAIRWYRSAADRGHKAAQARAADLMESSSVL